MTDLKSFLATLLLALPLAATAQTEATGDDDEFDVTFDTKTTTTSPKISNRRAIQATVRVDEFGDTVYVVTDDTPQTATIEIYTPLTDDEMPIELAAAMDSLLTLYNQAYLSVDEECDFPNVNPAYDDATYIQRLQKLPTIFEMPYNSVVRQMIDRYTARNRHAVSVMLATQNFYMPIFEQALETYGLPLELKYLPIIESGLNPKVVSRAGATGLWQFMIGTAKQYGLEVNSLVDERCDPVKSSYAAARYLADLYKLFGDWSLVIAAYNCGPGNVTKAIHRAGNIYDYWKIYPYLPKETRGYVPAFIAVNYVMNYYCEHNICPMLSRLPEQTDTIMVNRDLHFDQIAKVLDVSMTQLQQLNPQYRKNIVNGSSRPSILRLPLQQALAFADKEDVIYGYASASYRPKRATVEPGYEGESTAATQPAPATPEAGVSDPLLASNANAQQTQPQQRSQAPAQQPASSQRQSKYDNNSKSKGSNSNTKRNDRNKNKPVEHTIKKGESLTSIAKKHGTTVDKLRKLNPSIKNDFLREGKTIRVK